MDHVAQIHMNYDGTLLARCLSCGWRDEWVDTAGDAQIACDRHEKDARDLRLNSGARPSTAALIKQFKANSQNTTYERTEREMWAVLALELEKAQRKNQPSDGQLALPLD